MFLTCTRDTKRCRSEHIYSQIFINRDPVQIYTNLWFCPLCLLSFAPPWAKSSCCLSLSLLTRDSSFNGSSSQSSYGESIRVYMISILLPNLHFFNLLALIFYRQVAEKPSIALSIASVLSHGQVSFLSSVFSLIGIIILSSLMTDTKQTPFVCFDC